MCFLRRWKVPALLMRCRLMGLAMRGACGDCGRAGAAYSSPMAASSCAVAAAVMELLMERSSLPDAITSRHRKPLHSDVGCCSRSQLVWGVCFHNGA